MIRVCVLWKHPLFYDTIRSLLDHPEVETFGAVMADVSAKEQIDVRRPDIVIFERTATSEPKDQQALDVLGKYEHAIGLSLADNVLSVYTRHNHTVEDGADLLGWVLEARKGTEQ